MKLLSVVHLLKTSPKDQKKRCSKRKIFNKSGITIAEVVIAMAVVTVVSVAALTAIKSSSTGLIKDMAMVEINTYTSNSIEFFKYAENTEELVNNLIAYSGASEQRDAEQDNILVYAVHDSVYTLTFEIEHEPFPEGQKDLSSVKPLSIRATCVDTNGTIQFKDVGCNIEKLTE